jgi:hypothetical protein
MPDPRPNMGQLRAAVSGVPRCSNRLLCAVANGSLAHSDSPEQTRLLTAQVTGPAAGSTGAGVDDGFASPVQRTGESRTAGGPIKPCTASDTTIDGDVLSAEVSLPHVSPTSR